MKKSKLKIKLAIPEGATMYAENGDKTINLLLYEVEQLEKLDEIKLGDKKVKFHVKDGQFIKKGEPIFSEGLFGHKVFLSEQSGIIEMRDTSIRILGQKRYFERRINLQGEVTKIVPKKFMSISCLVSPVENTYYHTVGCKLSEQIYIHDKNDISSDKLNSSSPDATVYVNDNLLVEELARLIALGAKRVIVNSIFITDFESFKREVKKLNGFCVIAGFGEYISRKVHPISPKMNIYWGKKKLYLSDNVVIGENIVYEHPFWGLAGKWNRKNDLIGELEYNNEKFEFYLKNLESNA